MNNKELVHVSHPERMREERDRYKKALEKIVRHFEDEDNFYAFRGIVYPIAKSALNPDSVNNQK